jgi:leucyl aminopeptidase
MADSPKITFAERAVPTSGTLVLLAGADFALSPAGEELDQAGDGALARAAKVAKFTGKSGATLDVLAPAGTSLARILIVGLGKTGDLTPLDWAKAGGAIAGKLTSDAGGPVTILAETKDGAIGAEAAADLALGLRLGAYAFDRYKTKKKDDNGKAAKFVVACGEVPAARKAHQRREAIGEGVVLARDLVNAPPNDLGPVEFAKICRDLEEHGVEVEILTEKEMKKLGMHALLGVGQGSARGSRLVVMRWNGAKGSAQPVAFVGKGVVFDTGGISIKPAQGMEDMKGDMAGAAAVAGLLRALAGRKAKANVIGIVGLVENMPDGAAQRPGDIVTSMSGQTIEIINTDAEGRLVLADALWYCQDRFKPRFMVNLATLTGAVLVALGQEHAGLFSNDDELATRLTSAGLATGEKLWRLPLSAEYDKIIDSKFADVKNSGGRNAGSITAAQFLQRFVNDVPWAHLDIAGTGMAAASSELNRSWGPGFGVRLLDRLVADHYEG